MQALRQNARDRTDHVSLRSFKCPNNSKYKPTSGIFFNVWTPWIVHTSLDTSIHLPFLTQEVLQRPKCLFKVTISRRAPSTSQSFGVPPQRHNRSACPVPSSSKSPSPDVPSSSKSTTAEQLPNNPQAGHVRHLNLLRIYIIVQRWR